MTKGSDESWITDVHSDTEALQAWILAVSLKKVFTTRKLTVIVSTENVASEFITLLRKEFDLVILAPTIQQLESIIGKNEKLKNVSSSESSRLLSKFWGWTLKIWRKCVFISPNSLVLQNCDSLFECEEFSSTMDRGSSEPSLYVYKPNLETFEGILNTWKNLKQDNLRDVFDTFFKNWSKTSNHILDNSYNFVVNEDFGEIYELVKIQVYKKLPWTLKLNQWLQFYVEEIIPKVNTMEASSVKTYLTQFTAKLNLPKIPSNGPNPQAYSMLSRKEEEVLKNSISIVGLSCRFPDSNNPDEFWSLLSEGREGVRSFPSGRKNTYSTSDIDGVEGGFLKCAIDEFDAKFFGISPREAQFIDPQQRILLEVIWEALETAGIIPSSLKDSPTGAYIGIWQQDYESFIGSKGLSSSEFHHRYLGNAFSATSSRISYFLGLLGPNIAVESGCSSSLSALHLACQALTRGEISLAISSGVNLTLGVAKPLTMDTKTIVLSPDYRCKTFDESADGFVRAEGCGALILKRTVDAIRDGDNVFAIIRGSAMNNDGAGTSFGTPNANSQEKVFRAALDAAGIKANEVTYVEAHGTGTAVGDPIEMHALSRVYSEGRNKAEPLYVASVKTNIGHAESAAGIAGIIKTILAIQHGQIPAHLNLKTLNPHIDLGVIPAIIPSKLTEWTLPKGLTSRIAAVSSFSMSGTNVHVILQEPPSPLSLNTNNLRLHQDSSKQQQQQLITISAKSSDSLQTLASKYLEYFQANPSISLQNIAYTTNACRAHNFSHRIAIIANDMTSLIKSLQKHDYNSGKVPTVKPKIGFLFTGQGCQYVGMGQNLAATSAPFKAALEQCSRLFKTHLKVNLTDILWKDEGQALLQSTIYCQPAIFCLQYCLVQHWNRLGILPDIVLGHSVGEFAAGVAAGIFNLEEAMTLVIERSRLVQTLPQSSMLVLKTNSEKTKGLLKSFQDTQGNKANCWVDIAAINSTAEVVVSGNKDVIEKLEEYCMNNQVKCQKLASSHAFHSRAMDLILEQFESAVRKVLSSTTSTKTLSCTFISGTKSKAMELSELLDPVYWREHLRNTVRFSDAVQVLGSDPTCNILIEIGPQPILLGLVMGNLEGKRDDLLYCPSLRRSNNDSDWNIVLNTLAKLYIAGIDIDWTQWYAAERRKRNLQKLILPTYAFDRQKYWFNQQDHEDDEEGVEARGGFNLNTKLCHPVLGRQLPSPLSDIIYCQPLSTSTLPYVVDHKVGGKIILPGAVYLEGALAVGKELLGTNSSSMSIPLTITNVAIEAALEIDARKSVQMQTLVSCLTKDSSSSESEPALQYKISFHRPMVPGQYDNWKRHATATFLPVAPKLSTSFEEFLNIENVKARLSLRDAIAPVYTTLAEKGIEFGPKFQSIISAWTSESEILTLVQTPDYSSSDPNNNNNNGGDGSEPSYICHPIVLDAMFQTFAFGTILNGTLSKDDHWLRLPLSIRQFTWLGKPSTPNLYLYSSNLSSDDSVEGQILLYDQNGSLLAVLEGLELIKVSVDSFIRAIRAEFVPVPDFYQEVWSPRLGLCSARYDLVSLLNIVTNDSERTSQVVEKCNDVLTRNDYGVWLTNSMCFYYIMKAIHECGWSWPNVGASMPFDTWKPYLPEQLKQTRIHYSFMTAFVEEGYLSPPSNTNECIVLKPLPSLQDVQARIDHLQEEIPPLAGEDVRFYEFALHCSTALTSVLQGQVSTLSVLFPSDSSKVGASKFYSESYSYTMWSDVAVASFNDLLAKLASDKESSSSGNVLRILEVGAGTGATSGRIIGLLSELGIKYQYTFTDISHQFLEKAQEQFGSNPNIAYGILNLEQDPLGQGYNPGEYDIILAIQVIHATSSLETTLGHIQTLIRDNGVLMMTEQTKTRHFIKVSFALLEGWWRFNDFRTTSPVISQSEWSGLLSKSGFENISIIQTRDDTCGLLISRKTPVLELSSSTEVLMSEKDKTWILFGNSSTILNQKITKKLMSTKRRVISATPTRKMSEGAAGAGEIQKIGNTEYELNFDEEAHFKQLFEAILGPDKKNSVEGIIYFCTDDDLLELNKIQSIEKFKIGGLLHFFQGLTSVSFSSSSAMKFKPKVIVLTKGIHYLGDQTLGNPANATAWGCFRSFINECREFNACVIDLDQDESSGPMPSISDETVNEITANFWASSNSPTYAGSNHAYNADKFIVIRGGKKYVHKLALLDKPAPPLQLPTNTERYTFINPPSGSFSDIQVGPEVSRPTITDPHFVEVAVRAVGLNFRDLLCVLKPPGFEAYLTGGTAGNYDVGGDIAGVVVAIGENVTTLEVGDAVFGFTTTGGVKSHTITNEALLMKKPKYMPFTGAATLPVVFLTSYYCLGALGKLTSLDRILIHVATGGVGLAAIQIAKRVGATIYATAGSKRKRAYLRRHLGIQNVYNSRSLEYGPAIKQDTNGKGITIVLNSLTSPGFKETTLDCCSSGARFIEIGKLNIWTEEEVQKLRPDVQYSIVDLASHDDSNAEVIRSTFNSLAAHFGAGTFKPLPFTVFALERIRDAFYYFQEAKHIGKIVLKMPLSGSSSGGGEIDTSRKLTLRHTFFDPESTYLITGGLGGLGVEVTKWMTSTGAKNIVLAGRNPPTPQVQTLFDQLIKSTSCKIITVQSDVGDYNQVVQLLERIKSDPELPPLRGIFLASGILQDALIQNQSWEKFNAVFHPKVYGAWWLHQLTLEYDLEFFTMFSSMVAVIGMMGQTTHAAASRFLDSLAYYRVAMGLPGGTINWGAWSDVGAAAFLKLGQEGLVGIRAFTPSQGIHALEKFMLQNYTQACVLDVPDWNIVQQFLNLGSFLSDLKSASGVGDNADVSAQYAKLLEEINNCPPEDKQVKIQDYLEQILKHTLRLSPTDVIDPDQNFTELGVDSLMAMEMRNRLQGILVKSNKTLSINALQENRTLRSLSTHLANLINSSPDAADDVPIIELLKTDSVLPEDIATMLAEQKKNQAQKRPSEFKDIFLTGATGFLGCHILLELLKGTKLKVHCLIRANSKENGQNRLIEAFKHHKLLDSNPALVDLLNDESRISIVPGNVGLDQLGLTSPEVYEALASKLDAVIHCAIKSNHLESYCVGDSNNLRSQNIFGLLNILRFVACGKLKSLFHASSLLAVTKVTESGHLTEDFPTIEDYTETLKNGYSITKFVSEILIGQAMAAGLTNVKVLRYPSIWGNSTTGFISLDNNFNHGWNLLTTCIRYRKFPFMDNTNGITIVPVDVAAKLTFQLFLNDSAESGVYNMTTLTSVTQAVLEQVMAERGLDCEFLPLSQWRNEIFGSGDKNNDDDDGHTLEAFRWLYEDDEEGDQLRFRQLHPLFSKQTGDGPQVTANCISDKMSRNIKDLRPLQISAQDVIHQHLDYYFQ